MTSQQLAIHHAIKKVQTPAYVPPVEPPTLNPFVLGRRAAENNLPCQPTWPLRVAAGWQFETALCQQSNESFVISRDPKFV